MRVAGSNPVLRSVLAGHTLQLRWTRERGGDAATPAGTATPPPTDLGRPAGRRRRRSDGGAGATPHSRIGDEETHGRGAGVWGGSQELSPLSPRHDWGTSWMH